MLKRKQGREHGRFVSVVAGTLLGIAVLTSCSESAPQPPVVDAAASPADTSKFNVATKECDNYGKAVEAAAKFLVQHAADQQQVPPYWQRAVVVKTLYSPGNTVSDSSWQGTLVFPDGSINRLSSPYEENVKMAALVTVGDYIAYNNKDGDDRINAPVGNPKDELRFLGHGVISCA